MHAGWAHAAARESRAGAMALTVLRPRTTSRMGSGATDGILAAGR